MINFCFRDFHLNLNLNLCNNLALLCGMSGYLTFIDEMIAKQIDQWQIKTGPHSGCFEYFDGLLSTDVTSKKKLKRDANHLTSNCSDHMTGLAAAAYGLFAKITIHFYVNVY